MLLLVIILFSRRRLGVHAPSTDLRLARLGARLARLGVQPPPLARRPPYRLENRGWYWFSLHHVTNTYFVLFFKV